jgi:tetratricopeptide (TPR) repeat protein
VSKNRLLAFVVALAVIAYANALRNGFALDDIPIIVENPVVQGAGTVGTIFGTSYWSRGGTASLGDPTLYRPLTVLTYALDHAIWNLRPGGFHATNIALHAVTTALVFLLGVEVLGGVIAAFAAAAIFAVHPLHTEAVTGLVGRAEVLATLFVLAAFWTLRRPAAVRVPARGKATAQWSMPAGRIALGALLYLLGLFSKESAITLPAVLALDDWLRRDELPDKRRPKASALASRYAALVVAAIIYFAFRQHAISGNPEIWPGFVGVSAAQRVLTASRVMMEYVGLFVFPRRLLPDYWKSEVPIGSLGDPLVIVSIALWIGVAAIVWWKLRRDAALVFSVAWFFVTLAPVSNLFFPIGVAKAERILYLPSVGLCLLAGWAYARLEARSRTRSVPRVALAAIVLAFAARTMIRNRDWRDNFTLATAALATSPSSPLMNDIAAGELVKRGDMARATNLLREAVRQAPDMPLIRTHLGVVYYSQGLLDQAIAEYQEAIRRHPNEADAYNNLGVAYAQAGQLDRAVEAYEAALRLKPDYAAARDNLDRVNAARAARGAPKP